MLSADYPGKSTTGVFSARMRASLVSALLGLLMAGPATAGAPRDQIQDAIEKVTSTLRDPNFKSEGKKKERLERLRQIIFPKFDFTEMAKRSLGANWQRRSPEEQGEFVKLFTELIENSYADNLASYDGEKVTITSEKQDKEYAQVDTKIASRKGEEFTVNYKLLQASNDWKIYDVVIENISIVNNYRSQFNRVIAKSSFEDLMQKMKAKQFQAVEAKKRNS
jgi:phospholipid transport system substrate-binding protein